MSPRRRTPLPYRHTLTVSDPKIGWEGDVTVTYAVAWGRRASLEEPADGASVTGWEIVAVDRQPVGPEGAGARLEDLVEAQIEEVEADLIAAASEDDAYHAEQIADQRREELRTTGVRW